MPDKNVSKILSPIILIILVMIIIFVTAAVSVNSEMKPNKFVVMFR